MKLLQGAVDGAVRSTSDGYWPLEEQADKLREEAREVETAVEDLCRARRSGDSESIKCAEDHLKEELGDVFFALICIANNACLKPVDLDLEVYNAIAKFRRRNSAGELKRKRPGRGRHSSRVGTHST